jgi:hypothetical protein
MHAALGRKLRKGRIDGGIAKISRRIGADQAEFHRAVS